MKYLGTKRQRDRHLQVTYCRADKVFCFPFLTSWRIPVVFWAASFAKLLRFRAWKIIKEKIKTKYQIQNEKIPFKSFAWFLHGTFLLESGDTGGSTIINDASRKHNYGNNLPEHNAFSTPNILFLDFSNTNFHLGKIEKFEINETVPERTVLFNEFNSNGLRLRNSNHRKIIQRTRVKWFEWRQILNSLFFYISNLSLCHLCRSIYFIPYPNGEFFKTVVGVWDVGNY